MNLTYVELFAGAGGMSLGLEMAGWRCLAHAEWEDHPRAVLRKHWPDLPLLGDVTQVDGRQFKGVTMLTGGSPCQDLSVAGKRAGMVEGSGTRSSLFFEQVRIWNESEAPYILWENVYGAFSSNAGRDFAAVLSALVGAAVPVPADGWRGAGVASGPAGVAAWRTLDAQYFGVPQRRRRVFVLGVRAGGVDPAEVLSLAESLSGHLAASGTPGEGVAADAGAGVAGGSAVAVNISSGIGHVDSVMGTLGTRSGGREVGAQTRGVVLTFDARGNGDGLTVNTLSQSNTGNIGDFMPVILRNREGKPGGGKGPLLSEGKSLTLGTANDQVVFTKQRIDEYAEKNVGSTLAARDYKSASDIVAGVGRPRRLTPVECERLMGWPDGHTAEGIDESGKPYRLADTARYKLCGNGIASPVTAWLGFRLREYLTRANP